MAGIKLKKKVTGSTLVEVIISMVVIMIVFGIAMVIISNTTRYSISEKTVTAGKLLEDQLLKAEKTNIFTDQTLVIGDFTIEQSTKPFGNFDNLAVISLIAYDANNKVVVRLQKVEIKPMR